MPSFWSNDHELTPLSDELFERYIPSMGATQFIESECMRAGLKLHHDYFNNGFGNEMGQPVAYLEKYFLPRSTPEWKVAFEDISQQAMQPWEAGGIDERFDTFMSEIILGLKMAEIENRLTPIVEEMYEMPQRLIEWPEEESEDDCPKCSGYGGADGKECDWCGAYG